MQYGRNCRQEFYIVEDFNAEAHLWRYPVMKKRGEYLVEWIATLDSVEHNEGEDPLFSGKTVSHRSVTCSTQGIAKDIANWTILDE
ncbi:hypothetical protein JTB14_026974 [Gonioctena quinquepunctata]|nr:hypothetical protein JTB14_026974 [Gonioctena quinquepunctata]